MKSFLSYKHLRLILFLCLFLPFNLFGQFATTHYLPPAPWYYFDQANELVVSTLSPTSVNVDVRSSDGVLLTTLSVAQGSPIRYRFNNPGCGAGCTPAHTANTTYNGRGLIVSSTAKIAVSIRNVESDQINGGNELFIKGNSSLTSFGDQGPGLEFRLGYYRRDFGGLSSVPGSLSEPIYSVMAINNNTQVFLNGVNLVTLNAGQAYFFQTSIGSLLETTSSVVVSSGNWGDAPSGCRDGVVTQVYPVSIAGNSYLVVRGNGFAGTGTNLPEQSTFIATQNNTSVTVTNYNNAGVQISQNTFTLTTAGDNQNIHHGDATNIYSSSTIVANKPIVVFSGIAENCENDMYMLPPVAPCAGSLRIETRRFRRYDNNELPYVAYIVVNDATTPVFVNGLNAETISGLPRFQIGTTGQYLIRFNSGNIGAGGDEIVVTSAARVSISLVQQGGGFSMAGVYSSFNDTPVQPVVSGSGNCTGVTLTAEGGLSPYQWYYEGDPIAGATSQTFAPTVPGNYAVAGTRACGFTAPSPNIVVICTGDCPAGYDQSPIPVSQNGNFATQGGAVGGGILCSDNPATSNGTLNSTSGFFSQAAHCADGARASDGCNGGGRNQYSLMTGTFPFNNFGFQDLLNTFPGDPANNVPASNTYLYSNGNCFNGGEYVIWGQTLTGLTVGQSYTLYCYGNNAIEPPGNAPHDPIIRLRVGGSPSLPNGVAVAGPLTLDESLCASTQPLGGWQRLAYTFVASATTLTVKITSAALGGSGDDFQLTAAALVPCRPVITAANNGPLCPSSTLNLTASTPASGTFTYAWSGPSGFTSTQQNPIRASYTSAFAGVYTVTITDSNGVTNTATTTVASSSSCAEICNNGIDDDGDGNIDSGDEDCGPITCSGSVGDPIVNVTFGTGTYNPGANNPTLASVQPGASTTYTLVPPGDDWSTNQFFVDGGQYAIRNLTGRSNNEYGNGLTSRFSRGEDNTPGDVNGRCMLVNGDVNNNIFYRQTLTGLCPNTRYQFSFWAANINDTPAPNVQARIETAGGGSILAARASGPLPQAVGPLFLPIWRQTQFTFTTQAGQTSLDLVLFNFITSNGANDLAIDDITFRVCGPNINAVASSNNPFCPGQSVNLTATIGAGYTSPSYIWQQSTNGGTTWNDLPSSNSLTYTVSTPVAGHQYRIVAGDGSNVNDQDCRVVSSPVILVAATSGCAEICNNGIDDDGDSAIDCADSDCVAISNLLVNGSFENGLGNCINIASPCSPTNACGFCNTNEQPVGWTWAQGNFDIYQQGITGSDFFNGVPNGNYAIDLNGNIAGGLKQTINGVTVGVPHTLRFRYGNNNDGNTGTCNSSINKPLRVNIYNASNTLVYTNTLNTLAYNARNNVWGTEIVSFTPTTSTLTIEFLSLFSDGVNCGFGQPSFTYFGPALDDVSFGIPSASIIATPSSICLGNTANLNINSSVVGTYNWSGNGIINTNNAITTATPTVAGSQTYTVTITNSNNCTVSSTTTVIVNANPTVNITGTTAICSGTSTTLTANATAGSGTITNYAWSNGQSGATQATISVNTAGTYVVTVTNSNGCTATANRTVTVNTNPTVNVTGTTAICSGTSTTLTANTTAGSGTITNYAWSNGQSGATQTSISVNTAGTYIVTVTNSNGCTATANTTVTVNANPTVNVTGTTAICSGTSTTLTANATAGSGTITNYAWSNGQSGATQTTISVNTAGTYVVTVTNSNGCTATANTSVTVNANPTVNVTGTTAICSGTSTTLTANATAGSGTITNYAWSNSQSGATQTTISVNTAGTYVVTVTNSNGCTATANRTVTVNANPTVNVTGTTAICSGTSTTLTANATAGSGTITNYAWSNGQSGAAQTTISVNAAGTYVVTVTNSNGCTATANTSVTVNANPTVNVTGTTAICSGTSTTLTANATGGSGTITNYAWSNGQSGATQTTISVNAAGTYVVTVTNSNGCTATANITVTVNTTPTAGINLAETSGIANNDGIICAGASVQLTGTGGTTYTWAGAAIATPSSNPQNILPSSTGTYTVTVSSLAGCTATASQLITVNALPTATIVPGGGSTVCNTQSGLTLTASSGGTYLWSTGATTSAINIASSQPTTIYTVTVTNSNNCSATTSVTVTAVGSGTCNQAPIAINDINNTFINTPISGQVLTNDSDPDAGQTLTVNTTPSGVSGGTVVLNSNGTYTFTPTPGFIGVGQFTYTVCDNGSPQACDQATVFINITQNTVVNNPPVPSTDVVQTLVNTSVTGSVATNDIDPDGNINPNSFTLLTPPSATTGVLTLNSNGTYTFVPTTGFVGTAIFTYQVCDLGMPVLCATVAGVIEVYPNPNGAGNDAPNAQDDASSTLVNIPVLINPMPNDSDPNGDVITIISVTTPTSGTVVISSGNFIYTPAAGFVGTASFTYQICDSGAPTLCDNATVYVTVLPVQPFAENDINNVLPNTSVTGNVATNDENLLVGFNVNTTPISAPSHGTVSLNSNGTYTYTPTNGSNYIGVDSFQYQICNPGGLCDIAAVYINITANTGVNNPPAPGNDVVQTSMNTTLTGTVANNDIDPDGNINPSGFTLSTPPSAAAGTLTFNPNGTFSFVPTTGFVGTTTFTYQVCDLGTPVLCATAIATIEVLPDLNGTGNNEPNAQDDAFSGTGTAPINGNVLPNDSDPNGNTLTVNTTPVVNVTPAVGTLVLNSNGTFTFTPASGFTGTTSFVYQICDNGSPSLCDEATVYITVFNCALTAGSCVPQNDECQLNQGQVRIQAQGGKLPYSVTWTPAHGTPVQPAQIITEGGTLLIDGLHGNTTYLFTVTDANGCQVP